MRRKILLVEDNANDEFLTLRALRKYDNVLNDVVVARDGVEAVEYLFAEGPHAGRDVGDLPLVVLLDLKLPRLDGIQVLRRIRADERTRLIPVVILTSSNEERDVINGYKLGTNSYVQKPIEFTAFVDAVGKLGLYWMMLNEPLPVKK